MRATGAGRRRRPKESFLQDRKPPPPTPTASAAADPWQFTTNRDSDASFCSSRPSSASLSNRPSSVVPITDRSYQISALKTINSYLSYHSSQISLKPPLPSAKDIIQTLTLLVSHLDFPLSNNSKLEDDLKILLKHLNCPIKLNNSALKAPGTPHSWPTLLAVMHWLVQIAMYNDHLSNSSQVRSGFEDNSMFVYAINSYVHFIEGDDDKVEMLDREFMEKLQQERESMEEGVNAVEENVRVLEERLEALRTEPSAREVAEKEKRMLEEDVKKFHAMIQQFEGHIVTVEKVLEEKEKELAAKVQEKERICEENEELKKRVEMQGINSRDAERMKRELQAVERDIGDAEMARNTLEEKSWDLDATIGCKFKELEALSIECNQASKRLKLGNGFEYKLNAKGSTPAEVLGMDYKSTLKPALISFDEGIKKSSMGKLEELISLQQKSVEMTAKIEAKRNHIAALQSRIDELEAQLNSVQREAQEYTSRCVAEAQNMADAMEADTRKLEIVEKEAAELLKNSEQNLQDAIIQDEEETQMCARELWALIESVSKYKEYMGSKISEMGSSLTKTVASVSDLHKGSLTAQFGSILTQDSDA